jgi:hypothetical protein
MFDNMSRLSHGRGTSESTFSQDEQISIEESTSNLFLGYADMHVLSPKSFSLRMSAAF